MLCRIVYLKGFEGGGSVPSTAGNELNLKRRRSLSAGKHDGVSVSSVALVASRLHGCTGGHSVLISPLCAAAPVGAVTQLHASTTEGNTLVSRLQHKGMYNSDQQIVGLGSVFVLKRLEETKTRPKLAAVESSPLWGGMGGCRISSRLWQKHPIPESTSKNTSAADGRQRELCHCCFIVFVFFFIQYGASQ